MSLGRCRGAREVGEPLAALLPGRPTPVLAASCQRPALQALRIALHEAVVQLRGSSTDQPLLEANQSQTEAPKVNGFSNSTP